MPILHLMALPAARTAEGTVQIVIGAERVIPDRRVSVDSLHACEANYAEFKNAIVATGRGATIGATLHHGRKFRGFDARFGGNNYVNLDA